MKYITAKYIAAKVGWFASPGQPGSYQVFVHDGDGTYVRATDTDDWPDEVVVDKNWTVSRERVIEKVAALNADAG